MQDSSVSLAKTAGLAKHALLDPTGIGNRHVSARTQAIKHTVSTLCQWSLRPKHRRARTPVKSLAALASTVPLTMRFGVRWCCAELSVTVQLTGIAPGSPALGVMRVQMISH